MLAKLEERLVNGPPLGARDMIAYAKLCAEVEARDLPGDKPPVRIMVLRGSEADPRRAMNEPGVEARGLDEGDC